MPDTASAGTVRPAGGVKGDPQPELKPFTIAADGSGGASAAIEPDGALVVAYDVPAGDSSTSMALVDLIFDGLRYRVAD